MTLLEMATEVVAKCGEGYTSYTTRAKAALRTATAQAISTGAIPITEIDGSIKVDSMVEFDEGGQESYTIDLNTKASATDEILHTAVFIDQIQGRWYFTKAASKEQLSNAHHFRMFDIGSAYTGYKEVLWFVELPNLYLKLLKGFEEEAGEEEEELQLNPEEPDPEVPDTIPAGLVFQFQYRLLQIKMAVASFTTDNTQFNNFFNEKCQQIIIDIAAKNLAAEINR